MNRLRIPKRRNASLLLQKNNPVALLELPELSGKVNLDTKTGKNKRQKKDMKKRYKPKQKAQIVLEMLKEERTVTQISSEYGIHTSQLYKWKNQALEGLPNLFEEDRKTEKALQSKHEKQLEELYAEIGRLTTQLNWLKKKSGIEPIES